MRRRSHSSSVCACFLSTPHLFLRIDMDYVDPEDIERTEEFSRKLIMRRHTLLQMKKDGFGAGELMAAGYKLKELISVGIVVDLPGGYQVGAVVYSSDTFNFTNGTIELGERGVVQGQSDDGNGLKVKFDGGMLVDFCLHQVSQTRPPPRDSTTAAGLGAAAGAALCVLLLPIGL